MSARVVYAAAAALTCLVCSRAEPPARSRAWLRLTLPPTMIDARPELVARPARAVVTAERIANVLVLEIDARAARGGLTVELDGACPVRLGPGALTAGGVRDARVVPWLDFGPPRSQLGFDAPFSIQVEAGCGEARVGSVVWRQVGGEPLREVAVTDRGFRFAARTAPADTAFGERPAWGALPISPRTRGEAVLVAEWSGAGPVRRFELRVAAAARSRGLPNVPVGVRQYLGGEGWWVVDRPPEARAEVEVAGGLLSLTADGSGLWRLRDRAARELVLRAGRYDETPLDCGRGGCHGPVVAAAAASPMTSALARLAGAAPSTGSAAAVPASSAARAACAIACHAVGEPGVDDGGFAATAVALGHGPHSSWHDLPSPLRRAGGVGCLSCHGPGAVPEPSARWSQLRADVCATCHDAPPRYGHVAAWRTSRMATADRDPRVRAQAACARCHTTAGFLVAAAAGTRDAPTVAAHPPPSPPEGAGPVGIACAACHAVHDPLIAAAVTAAGARVAPGGPPRALLREVPPPTWPGAPPGLDAGSALCVSCHGPDADAGIVFASAAPLVFGSGGVEPSSGAPLDGASAHTATARACLGCHAGGPAELERGAGHAFRARREICAGCHASGVTPDPGVRDRALALWRRAHPRRARATTGGPGAARDAPDDPPHAVGAPLGRRTPRERALWNVLLVLEDRAAAVHNAPYARRLLDAAARVLEEPRP